jgi:hypothetical protein
MDGELADLASSAATLIVGLMATDAWDQVKVKVAALWRRFRPGQSEVVESELDRGCLEVAGADEMVAAAVSREWESRLLHLMAADVAVTAELDRLVAGLRQIPVGQQAYGVKQTAKVSGKSTVIQIGGSGSVGQLPSIRHRSADGGSWLLA